MMNNSPRVGPNLIRGKKERITRPFLVKMSNFAEITRKAETAYYTVIHLWQNTNVTASTKLHPYYKIKQHITAIYAHDCAMSK